MSDGAASATRRMASSLLALLALVAAGCAGRSTIDPHTTGGTSPALPGSGPDAGAGYPDVSVFPQNSHRVQVVYLVPADVQADAEAVDGLTEAIAHLQIWIRDQLGDHRSFTLASAPVLQLESTRPTAWFSTNDPEGPDPREQWWQLNVRAEVEALADATPEDEDTFWLVYVDGPAGCDQVGSTVIGHVAMYGLKDLRGVTGQPLPPACPGQQQEEANVCRFIGAMALWMIYGLGDAVFWDAFRSYPDPLDGPGKAVLEASPFIGRVELPANLPPCG